MSESNKIPKGIIIEFLDEEPEETGYTWSDEQIYQSKEEAIMAARDRLRRERYRERERIVEFLRKGNNHRIADLIEHGRHVKRYVRR